MFQVGGKSTRHPLVTNRPNRGGILSHPSDFRLLGSPLWTGVAIDWQPADTGRYGAIYVPN
jgi:hypothetical protein